ncbi:hypothetical protein MMYC01_205699 [Madurella mycetomatis]|uniref:Uncharacterized protein n=1 Tax=Madurella mycetomatis TaxID=100816 RepID=A0A175W1L0_9PEZI|nr:hypothetical protein MMYC01_205699 [Madurella mycetomatis]
MQYKMSYTREPIASAPRLAGRPSKTSARAAEGQFDPDELTRRLYIVLAEQQQHAERKRRIRGDPSKPRDGAGPAPSTRHRDHAGPGRKERREPVETPADLITELRKSKSAKRKPSHTVLTAVAAPNTGIAAQAGEYHHVPQEAAKQFTRTATQENMRSNTDLVHKLSKRALKFHMEGGRTTRPGGGKSAEASIAPAELSRALRRSQSQRDKALERNQFQRTRILDEAAQMDHAAQQHPHSPSKHTFGSELTRMMSSGGHHHAKYNNMHAERRGSGGSTGVNDAFDQRPNDHGHNRRSFMMLEPLVDIIEDVTPPLAAEEEGEQLACPPHERRVDWTQSDESLRARPKQLLTPLLRKADSLWTLRGRIGSKASSSPSSGASGHERGEDKENGSPKSPKVGGFLAKFKR